MPRDSDVTSAETIAARDPAPPTPFPSLGSSSIPDEGRFLPGTLLGGRYRIIGLLGQGGMGEVYRATDVMLAQSVALKLLPETASANPFLLERFHSEVRVARQVSHPNVCRVYDIGEAEGLPFISMEYVDGEDLGSLLQRIGRLPCDRAIVAARQICAGLAAAHGKGVIHRDLKPQNIMMDKRGQIMIMDFGLASLAQRVTGVEARNGTPAYMSPEQLKGADVTARSDIYALGLVLYEIFTGRRPFEADNIQDLIARQEHAQLTRMSSIATDIDPAVDRIIRRCLDPEPDRRPQSALSVSAALPGGDPLAAALAAGETPSPEMVAAAGKTEPFPRRFSVPCLCLVVACLIATPFLKQQSEALIRGPAGFPPDVLRQKARDLASGFGYPDRPADSALWLDQRLELLQYLGGLPGPKKWDAWLASESAIAPYYRESAMPLVAKLSGLVDRTDPPPTTPGMVQMQLDGSARLRDFFAIPPPGMDPARPVPPEAVFSAAQLDVAKFTPAAPITMPRGPSDTFLAWRGVHPVLPNTPVTVEIAWWKGRVTDARVLTPWAPAGTRPVASPVIARVGDIIAFSMTLAGILVAAMLSRRNWKLGRGDRRGALVIAVAMFALSMGIWAGGVHAIPRLQMINFLENAAARALFFSALFWMLYLALEPALRSRWPHSIVTWNRVLAGRWRDPRVAGDVLVGAAIGCGLLTATGLLDAWDSRHTTLGTAGGLYLLNGTLTWFAGILGRLHDGVQSGLLIFFCIFGLRVVLRNDWVAALAGALLFAATEGDVANAPSVALAFAVMAGLYSVLIFALLRVGLLAAVFAVFSLNMLNGVSLGTDWTTWYTPNGLATAAVLLGLSLFAFAQSLHDA